MFNVVQHFKNIKKIFSLNLKLIYIIKYILGIFEKKIIQFNNISQIEKFKKIYIQGSYSFNWTTGNSHNFLTIAKVFKKMQKSSSVFVWDDNKKSLANLRILEIGSFEGYSVNIFNNVELSVKSPYRRINLSKIWSIRVVVIFEALLIIPHTWYSFSNNNSAK